MKPRLFFQATMLLLSICFSGSSSLAGVVLVNSPSDISGTSINFDGHPNYTIANTLYQSEGITFTRDDGEGVFLFDWTSLGRTTTSPRNVLATISGPGVSDYVSHLNVLSSAPFFAMGAYFGNDQGDSHFTAIKMSAYGLTGNFLGSVQVAVNNNTSVDQFIGLRSDDPIASVGFDNLTSAGTPSDLYSVVIDDLIFAPVPEPSTLSISLVALLGTAFALRRMRNRNRA